MMKAAKTTARKSARSEAGTPEAQLKTFIGKFDSKNQAFIRACRKALQKRLPGTNELVYDNYNFFVIGYSPTERPTDSIVSLAAGASGLGLCFPYCGSKLPDPHKLLLGAGTKNRFVRLDSAATLGLPEVNALIAAAEELSKKPPVGAKRKLIIRSISTKQRPRRKGK
jgi:hypothetical protein